MQRAEIECDLVGTLASTAEMKILDELETRTVDERDFLDMDRGTGTSDGMFSSEWASFALFI